MKSTSHAYPSRDGALPSFAVQLTELGPDSFMIWAGVSDAAAGMDGTALLQGKLGSDWAVSMPQVSSGRDVVATLRLWLWLVQAPAGTQLLQTAGSDIAQAMANRLARRWKVQMFVSVDVPVSFMGGSGLSLAMEREVNALLAGRIGK